jgi:hypothetical protein
MIKNGVAEVNYVSGPENSMTVLKRMIQTASLVIPSPNIKLNNFGCSSYLTIEIAATTSVQHNNEHINKISMIESSNYSYILIFKLIQYFKSYPVTELYFQRISISTTIYVKQENKEN